MRFRFLLWLLGHWLASASRNDREFRQRLTGRRLVFQLQTLDGHIARHFIVGEHCVHSATGLFPHPDFSIVFRSAACGASALRRPQRQLAFLTGIQNGDIQFRGNPALVLWFQDLLDCLDRPCPPPGDPQPDTWPQRDPAGRPHP